LRAERQGRGGGCRHIESGETGERRMPPRLPLPPWRCPHGPGYGGELEEKAGRGGGILQPETGERRMPPRLPNPRGDITHGPAYGENLEKRPARGFALPDAALPGYRHDCPRPPGGAGEEAGGRAGWGMPAYGKRRDRGGKVAIWTLNYADAGILQPETGEGAFCPLPVCPTPVEMSPRSSVWGEPGEKAGRGFALPDAVFPGYRHDCPRPPWRCLPRSSV
jgi:hypothetical protein